MAAPRETIPRCPICKEPLETLDPKLNPALPFCSLRCQQRDLAKWLDGAYAIPGRLLPRDMPFDEGEDAGGDN